MQLNIPFAVTTLCMLTAKNGQHFTAYGAYQKYKDVNITGLE